MIVYDTETTGLVGPAPLALDKQPYIIEFYGSKLNDKTLEQEDELHFLANPGFSLPEVIVKITGITDKDLVDKPGFVANYPALARFFFGQFSMAAHNLEFDAQMLEFELTRIAKQFRFPWPPRRICTVEASYSINNRRMKNTELYELATGKKLTGAHRAKNDVLALCDSIRWLKKKGLLPKHEAN